MTNRSAAGRALANARWNSPSAAEDDDEFSEPCDCDICVASGCNDPEADKKPPHAYGPKQFRPYKHWHAGIEGPGRLGAHFN